ncbi:MAG TPA: CDP-alcohol phosphatidyltransferase family protein [Kofleriaceae bacterium]
MPGTVFLDYATDSRIPAMRVGGVSIVERVLRDAAARGVDHAIVRADSLPPLPGLSIAVVAIPAPAPAPTDAETIAADTIAGVRVTDEASRRRAHRALLQTCRRPYDGVGDRYVIRAFSLRLTGLLCRTRITPNQVTSANIVVGFAACYAALTACWWLAGLLAFVQVVLDSSDGELARVAYRSSRAGMILDNCSDDLIDNLFVACLGLGMGGVWAYVGVIAACARSFCALMIHITVARAGKLGDVMAFQWWFDKPGEELAERFEQKLTVGAVARAFGRRDLYVLVWAAACIAHVPVVGLVVSAFVSASQFGLAVAHLALRGR